MKQSPALFIVLTLYRLMTCRDEILDVRTS